MCFSKGVEAMQIGNRIKIERQKRHMSQKELAQDICSQTLISRVEKGEIGLGTDILYKISQRLGLPIQSFFNESDIADKKLFVHNQRQILAMLCGQDYLSLQAIIQTELKRTDLSELEVLFYHWVDSQLVFYIDHDHEESISQLTELLDKATAIENRKLEAFVAYSIGVIYTKINDELKATSYLKRAQLVSKKLDDFRLNVDIMYHLGRNQHLLHRNGEAIKTLTDCIDLLVKKESLYHLGEVLYERGNTLFEMGMSEDALEDMTGSQVVYRLQQNSSNVFFTKERIQRIESDLKK